MNCKININKFYYLIYRNELEEETNSHQEINEDENEIILNKKEKSKTSDVEDNSFEKNLKSKEKGKQ